MTYTLAACFASLVVDTFTSSGCTDDILMIYLFQCLYSLPRIDIILQICCRKLVTKSYMRSLRSNLLTTKERGDNL